MVYIINKKYHIINRLKCDKFQLKNYIFCDFLRFAIENKEMNIKHEPIHLSHSS